MGEYEQIKMGVEVVMHYFVTHNWFRKFEVNSFELHSYKKSVFRAQQ